MQYAFYFSSVFVVAFIYDLSPCRIPNLNIYEHACRSQKTPTLIPITIATPFPPTITQSYLDVLRLLFTHSTFV